MPRDINFCSTRMVKLPLLFRPIFFTSADFEHAFAHEDAMAANTHLGDVTARLFHRNIDQAWATHLKALLTKKGDGVCLRRD